MTASNAAREPLGEFVPQLSACDRHRSIIRDFELHSPTVDCHSQFGRAFRQVEHLPKKTTSNRQLREGDEPSVFGVFAGELEMTLGPRTVRFSGPVNEKRG
jgi:hypothetical protein